jgi:hypothetical protein
MTHAKLAFMVLHDGFDRVDGAPLVRITKGEAEQWVAPTRVATGRVDLRCRPMYREWEAALRIRYDAGMMTADDVTNLINRVGLQVGIGEGRPDSKGTARHGKARHGRAPQARRGEAGQGKARHGRQGEARPGAAPQARRGRAWHGTAG